MRAAASRARRWATSAPATPTAAPAASATPRRRCAPAASRSAYGETDFLTFYRPRHNFYRDPLGDQECVADWQCDGRYPSAPGVPGSVCDRAARRCSRPVVERETQQVTYHLNAGFPKHLVGAAFEVVGNWNEALMRGQRTAVSAALPDYAAVDEACQEQRPHALLLLRLGRGARRNVRRSATTRS
jgi:hypothetical protein